MESMKKISDCKGVTLVDVVVATLILVLVISGVYVSFINAGKTVALARHKLEALYLATAGVEGHVAFLNLSAAGAFANPDISIVYEKSASFSGQVRPVGPGSPYTHYEGRVVWDENSTGMP